MPADVNALEPTTSRPSAQSRQLSGLQAEILRYMRDDHAQPWQDWTDGSEAATIESQCDIIYSLYLAGLEHEITPTMASGFAERLNRTRLAGWRDDRAGAVLTVHNTAYAFGALNLLHLLGLGDHYAHVLENRRFAPEKLVDITTADVRYPYKYTHHNWRVSHWLGGVPSIFLSLEQAQTPIASTARTFRKRVLDRLDEAALDPRTGLIRLYRLPILQKLFHTLYSMRHDPRLGDLGGVAHILWIEHAVGKPYLAPESLHALSRREMLRHSPFMEGTPYCLDFDIVQIVRTSATTIDADVRARAAKMIEDSLAFLTTSLSPAYRLHRLPGALATIHECALILGQDDIEAFGPSRDIIKAANWL